MKFLPTDLAETPLFYSCWHSCSVNGTQSIDLQIGKHVSFVFLGLGTPMFCFELTDLVFLEYDDSKSVNEYTIWNRSAGSWYIEVNGIRYIGILDGSYDNGHISIPNQSYGYVNFGSIEENIVESFFRIRQMYLNNPNLHHSPKYEPIESFLERTEPLIKEIYPERFI